MIHNSTHLDQIEEHKHSTSTKDAPLVDVTKTFHAPVEQVFNVWSDADLIAKWWGPETMQCTFAKTNFKVGGKYLFSMQSIQDERNITWSTGVYEKVLHNKKIVFSDYFADENGNIIAPQQAGFDGLWPGDGRSFVTVQFEALEKNKTKVHLIHEGLPAHMHDDCVKGWSSSLDKIKKLVEKH